MTATIPNRLSPDRKTYSIEEVARLLGINRSTSYELARAASYRCQSFAWAGGWSWAKRHWIACSRARRHHDSPQTR